MNAYDDRRRRTAARKAARRGEICASFRLLVQRCLPLPPLPAHIASEHDENTFRARLVRHTDEYTYAFRPAAAATSQPCKTAGDRSLRACSRFIHVLRVTFSLFSIRYFPIYEPRMRKRRGESTLMRRSEEVHADRDSRLDATTTV